MPLLCLVQLDSCDLDEEVVAGDAATVVGALEEGPPPGAVQGMGPGMPVLGGLNRA